MTLYSPDELYTRTVTVQAAVSWLEGHATDLDLFKTPRGGEVLFLVNLPSARKYFSLVRAVENFFEGGGQMLICRVHDARFKAQIEEAGFRHVSTERCGDWRMAMAPQELGRYVTWLTRKRRRSSPSR